MSIFPEALILCLNLYTYSREKAFLQIDKDEKGGAKHLDENWS